MIVNQPHDEQLGIKLIEAIKSGKYSQLTIMVAYAKLSGVYRISPYIEKFRENGNSVRCIVGIDQQNTTYDALAQLLKLSNDVTVFHSESVSQTFHIKCYWLTGKEGCWYAIGSNNLTAGGLFSNYELSTTASLAGDDANAANSTLESIYATYSDPSSVCSRKLDEAFLDELLSGGYVTKELQQRKAFAEAIKQTRGTARKKKLFGNEVFSAPALPEQYRTAKPKADVDDTGKKDSKQPQKAVQITPTAEHTDDNAYLIRLVPRAGNRSKQVHFTVDLLAKYFCLTPGNGILVQEMRPSGDVGEIEHRQIVFSQRKYSLQGTTQGRYLTGGVPPVRFSM